MALNALAPEEVVAEPYHAPVMVDEVLDLLRPREGGAYLDGTVGGGGHARRILEACGSCTLVAVDRDPDALREAGRALEGVAYRVRFLEGSFDRVAASLLSESEGPFQGALLDLGVSSHQLDEDARGFAFRRGVALDMRMSGSNDAVSAADLLNEGEGDRLRALFRDYGEEQRSGRLAREIVKRRRLRPFATSDDLVAALAASMGRAPSQRDKARIFQALRIAVNDEIEVLTKALPSFRDLLAPQGVLVVIAYHSIEDRAVKAAFREWSASCVCPPGLPVCACRGHALGSILTPKPLRPSPGEVEANARARSARLRAWRKDGPA